MLLCHAIILGKKNNRNMMVFYYKGGMNNKTFALLWTPHTLKSGLSVLDAEVSAKATKPRHQMNRMKAEVCTWVMLCFLSHLTCGSELECIIREIEPAQLYKCSGVLLPTLYKKCTAEQKKKGKNFCYFCLRAALAFWLTMPNWDHAKGPYGWIISAQLHIRIKLDK